jgi:hypothetical protein
MALGDPTSLQHILVQLVQNAVKYSPQGGTVWLTARRDGRYAVVEVADEGVGIPENAGAILFAPFFQAGKTNTREFGGLGLGLYIVRQLVEAQGGQVAAANRIGGGTVVRFTVPLAAPGMPAPAPPEQRAEASWSPVPCRRPGAIGSGRVVHDPAGDPENHAGDDEHAADDRQRDRLQDEGEAEHDAGDGDECDRDPGRPLVLVGGVGLTAVSEIGHGTSSAVR